MWFWIYRIVAALLALAGSAVLAFLGQAAMSQAHEITIVFGQAAFIALLALASSMLTACVMILISPASRGDAP
jgi:hypothetical protein